jgi:tetratricopeptide (TPR) repeat protein
MNRAVYHLGIGALCGAALFDTANLAKASSDGVFTFDGAALGPNLAIMEQDTGYDATVGSGVLQLHKADGIGIHTLINISSTFQLVGDFTVNVTINALDGYYPLCATAAAKAQGTSNAERHNPDMGLRRFLYRVYQGDDEKAVQAKLFDESRHAAVKGDWVASVQKLKHLVQIRPESASFWSTEIGILEVLIGRWDDATARLSEAVERDPNNLEARLGLAQLRFLRDGPESAMRELELCLVNGADQPLVSYLKGIVAWGLGLTDMAREALLACEKRRHALGAVYGLLALIARESGRPKEARLYRKRAEELGVNWRVRTS